MGIQARNIRNMFFKTQIQSSWWIFATKWEWLLQADQTWSHQEWTIAISPVRIREQISGNHETRCRLLVKHGWKQQTLHRIRMYAIYGNIYHQYTPNVGIYTIHGSYGYYHVTGKLVAQTGFPFADPKGGKPCWSRSLNNLSPTARGWHQVSFATCFLTSVVLLNVYSKWAKMDKTWQNTICLFRRGGRPEEIVWGCLEMFGGLNLPNCWCLQPLGL